MKVFLTFAALFTVSVNMMVFHDDMRIYNGIRGNIESAAENCAHGASTYFDLESYADGSLVYDRDQAAELIDNVKTRCREGDSKGYINDLHVTAYFFDEFYEEKNGKNIRRGMCHVVEDGSETSNFKFDFPYAHYIYRDTGAGDGAGERIMIEEPSVGVLVKADIRDPFRQPFIGTGKVTGYCVYGNQAA